jgi:hypothetical protein
MSKASRQMDNQSDYIQLLSQYASSKPTEGAPSLTLLGELIDAKLLTGAPLKMAGKTINVTVTGITVEGRLFLHRLREEERQDRLLHKSLKYVPILIGYIAGLLSPLLTDLIKTLLN